MLKNFVRPSKEEMNELPAMPDIPLSDLYLVTDERSANYAQNVLANEAEVGFDTETPPNFVKGATPNTMALIQFATSTQVFLFPTRYKPGLSVAAKLIEDTGITKVGAGLKFDRKTLKSQFGMTLQNTIDLSTEIKQLTGDKNPIGLRTGVAMVLGYRLSKSAQKSNWEQWPLSPKQIQYAAKDALACKLIQNRLQFTALS